MKKPISIILSAFIMLASSCIAQTNERIYSNRFSILAGLIQPVALSGFNLEVNYFTTRMSFDYSHGISLDPPPTGKLKEQGLTMHLPFSTGFGIGYRINSFLDVRLEPKLHSWEVFHADEPQVTANRIASYKTFTLGIGCYYRYMPFRNSANTFLQGIATSASLRYWPNIGSTLSGDRLSIQSKVTEKTETLHAANIGIANTPIIVNISVGYTFGGK